MDARDGAVLARRRRRLGALVLEDKPLAEPDPDKLKAAMLEGSASSGSARCPGPDELAQLAGAHRLPAPPGRELARSVRRGPARSLDAWLAPFLDGVSRRAIWRVDLAAALKALLPWDRQRELDRLAPTHIEVPSGSRVPSTMPIPAEPTLSVRLQEMFGLATRRASAAARCR